MRGIKNFWIVKYDISAFFCTKNYVKILKTCENRFSWKLQRIFIFLGEVKIWKNFILTEKIFSQFFQFSSKSILVSFQFFHIFLCKRKLTYHTSRFKSNLFPSLVFYPNFLTSKVGYIWVLNVKSEQTSRLKKWGKKLARGWNTFEFFRAWFQLSFAQKTIEKSLKLANVLQFAQMYTFARNPGK